MTLLRWIRNLFALVFAWALVVLVIFTIESLTEENPTFQHYLEWEQTPNGSESPVQGDYSGALWQLLAILAVSAVLGILAHAFYQRVLFGRIYGRGEAEAEQFRAGTDDGSSDDRW